MSSAPRLSICLIRPPAVESLRLATSMIAPPLGLAYVAGALERAGHDVAVIDAVTMAPARATTYCKGVLVGAGFAEIAAAVPRDVDLIGLTVGFTPEWPAAVELVAELARHRPGVPIIAGGEHVTALPEFSLATSELDVAVLGEGEETVVELAATLAAGEPLDRVAGIAFRAGARVRVNPRRARCTDIDAIARPAWHLFDLACYHAHHHTGGVWSERLTVPILATRGCPYQCTFCSSPNMWTTQWVARDPTEVVDEIEEYVARYGAGNFPFQDLTAFIRRDWLVAFCRELLRRGLDVSWQLPTGTRCEVVDARAAELMRRSGMLTLAFAPESAADTTRRLVKKQMKRDKLDDAIAAATGAGLHVSVFFAIGFPHDTKRELAENLPFLDDLAAAGVADVSVTHFMALPGTELFHTLFDAGRLELDREYFRHIPDGLNLVPLKSYCPGMGRARLAWWKLRFYLRFYRRRRRSLRSATAGLRRGSHRSKLQTAVRSSLVTLWRTLRARFKRRWLPLRRERALMAEWAAIYRRIRAEHIARQVVVPAEPDAARLAERTIVPRLAAEHGATRTVTLPGPVEV